MTLAEKLDMLDLSAEERIKAEEKFLAALSLVTDEEFKEVISRLKSFGISITKARELKILTNSPDEITKKFNILSEIHETDIYKEDPRRINLNVIDIYKKIKYCKQTGKSYKKEDGSYELFLFTEGEWQKAFTQDSSNMSKEKSDDVITLEPNFNPNFNSSFQEEPFTENQKDNIEDSEHMDIQEYMKANNDMKDIEAQSNNFASIRQELENQLADLDNLKSFSPDDVISFNDIEVENYGMGR